MKTKTALAGKTFPKKLVARLENTCATTLLPFLLLFAMPALAQLQFTYTTNNGTITITRYDCSGGGAVVIPDKISGLPVTGIGDFAFGFCTSLTNITIPKSVTSIGEAPFHFCTSLLAITVDSLNPNYSALDGVLFDKNHTTLVQYPGGKAGSYSFPDTVTSIGGSAFEGCSSLASVTIPDRVTSIGRDTFTYCSGLTSVTIGNGVTSIGGAEFSSCSSLTSVTIPNSVKSIEVVAFSQCTSLTNVVIPNSVTFIGSDAFKNCSTLANVTIPDSVTFIGSGAFAVCTSLTSVRIPRSASIEGAPFSGCTNLIAITTDPLNTFYTSVDGVLFDKTQTTLIECPSGLAGSYTIPNSVTTIGYGGFYGCTRLASVMIPNTVTNIGSDALRDCISLTSLTIPSGVTSLGYGQRADGVFAGCSNLATILVDPLNPLYSSVDGVLFDKTRTTLVQCPPSKAGSYTIPSTVTSIRQGWIDVDVPFGAFSGCTSLTSITLPDSINTISDYAFYFCASLTNVTIPNSVTNIGARAFQKSGLRSVTIPDSVTGIGDFAFAFCTSLTNVTIGNRVTSIGDVAFAGSGLCGSVTIPDSVTSIGAWEFQDCECLRSITIGKGVANIGDGALSGLGSITLDPLNPFYSMVDGILFNKSQTMLIRYPSSKAGSPYSIPDSVTSIGSGSFGYSSLTNVTIPNSVTSIGQEAFSGCARLTRVYFQGNAPSADWTAFSVDTATAYYLPGTTGWGSTLGGISTALWVLPAPVILNSGPSFGGQTNGFGFTISWATNASVVVEASTDLHNPKWSPVQTNALNGGTFYFYEPKWTNYLSRFYRVRSQ